jgi:predicted Zn-dependent protease with MMP-like domain
MPDRPSGVTLRTVQTGDGSRPERPARVRRRDRHGRGARGILAPPGVPVYRTRAQRFDDLVLQAVARLEPRWEAHLAGVEFAVEEIPPVGDAAAGPVPLSRLESGTSRTAGGFPPSGTDVSAGAGFRPPRIVVYRRPLVARADGDDDLGELVFEVLVEEFARLLGINPEDVDPTYPAED